VESAVEKAAANVADIQFTEYTYRLNEKMGVVKIEFK
jgi:hypothetical protein